MMVQTFMKRFLFTVLGAFALVIYAQDQSGFISIDCGRPFISSSYSEKNTGLVYVSDSNLVDSGESNSILLSDKDYQEPLLYLRSFPHGIRNCYKIDNIENGTKYLIRTSFLYGNYDGLNRLPEFELYLGANLWDSVKLEEASIVVEKEIIHVALQNYIHVCLVNKELGTPFISSIELRPLRLSYYKTETPVSLALVNRWDTGSALIDGGYRYPVDVLDRIWYPYHNADLTNISTSFNVATDNNTYDVPSLIVSTAATPKSENGSLDYWLPNDTSARYYVYMHFAEVQNLQLNQSRQFSVIYNGNTFYGPFSPFSLRVLTIYSNKGMVGGQRFIMSKTANSTLPPIINAIEVFVVKEFLQPYTQIGDVDAITSLKSTFGVKRNWQGDPCTPEYLWEGLNCSYVGDDPPRIISLNLSSSGLTGEIPIAISNLTMIEILDLSDNNFTGSVLEFLSQLPNLRVLNLEKNNLSGSVPVELIHKSNNGSLELRVGQNPDLCVSDSCKKEEKKKNDANIIVPVVASVAGTLMLLLIVMAICWGFKRKRQHMDLRDEKSPTPYGSVESMQRQFTWSEILRITNNFERVLGQGGFGSVYHGYLDDTQVAVKLLSPSAVEGYQQFHAEVNLLMRVHHRNLTRLVGYCNDGTNTGLIYEYMANGNLQAHFSADDSSKTLNWEDRLRIALDAAQGLEYLHHGCRPPIVHRDVKSTNILLNENLQAKLSDFGLSRIFPTDTGSYISTVIAGTPGYLDPEYYISSRLNEKSDVYSFGVVLLEIITGLPAINKSEEKIHIGEWVNFMLEKGDMTSIVDPKLQGNFDINAAWKAVEIAVNCISPKSIQRPTMNQVVAELKECLVTGKVCLPTESKDEIDTKPLYSITEMSPLAR